MTSTVFRWSACLILGAVFLSHAAAAAEVNCTYPCDRCNPRISIASQSDADDWSQCGILPGTVIIKSHNLTTITFHNVTAIQGSFNVSEADSLKSISAPALKEVGTINVDRLPLLSSISFPSLINMTESPYEMATLGSYVGEIVLNDLPQLRNLQIGNLSEKLLNSDVGYTQGIFRHEDDFDFYTTSSPKFARIRVAGTGIERFDGYLGKDYDLELAGNPELYWIDLSGVEKISNLTIANNGPRVTLRAHDLRWGKRITIMGVDQDMWFPVLDFKADCLSCPLTIANNTFKLFSAPNAVYLTRLNFTDNVNLKDIDLPLLQSVDGSITITGNNALEYFSLSSLNYTQGKITIEGNDKLRRIYMPLLEISSNVSISGNISSVKLNLARLPAYFDIKSTSSTLDCSVFDKLNLTRHELYSTSYKLSEFHYSCTAFPPGTNIDTAQHWTHSKQLKKSYIVLIAFSAIIFVCAVVTGLYMLKQRLKRWAMDGRETTTTVQLEEVEGANARERLVADGAGVERIEEMDEELPKYERVGKPGEVLPSYVRSSSVVVEEPVNAEVRRGNNVA